MRARKVVTYFCVAGCIAACAGGCLPIATMRWSSDGSVGVLVQSDGVMLVDGETGETAVITKAPYASPIGESKGSSEASVHLNILCLPDFSADAKFLVYAMAEPVRNLDEFLQRLPRTQVEMIESDAQLAGNLRRAVAALPDTGEPPTITEVLQHLSRNPLAASSAYCNLVTWYLRERGEPEVRAALPPAPAEDEKAEPFPLAQLFLLPIREVGQGPGRFITANLCGILHPQLSSDGRFVAYLCPSGPMEGSSPNFDLWVSSLKADPVVTVRLAQNVAFGYTWRPDGRGIACLTAPGPAVEGEISVGTLKTIEVADAEGTLLAKKAGDETGYVATGTVEDLAAAWFSPFAVVAYHHTGRLLFFSVRVTLPSTPSQKPQAGTFAFDPVTRTVTDVLPSSVSAEITSSYFAVSPDGRRLLIPIMHHGETDGFMVYGLGESSATTPLKEKAVLAGDKHPPAWKGSDHIACWVEGKSALLKDVGLGERAANGDFLVEVDLEGNLVRVLIAPEPPEETGPGPETPRENLEKKTEGSP